MSIASTSSDRAATSANRPIRLRLAKAGLISLLLLGVVITPVWMGGLAWGAYLIVRWLVG